MIPMPRLLCVMLVVALCGAARDGRAQAPAERVVLEALRDSLAQQGDTTALRRQERAVIAVARVQRDDPMLHLRLGFIALRLGELGIGKPSFDDAAGEFEWATELRPEWPYPWYGLGLSELALGEHAIFAIENLRQMLGRDYLSKAARAFARAAQADPGFAFAVVDLANTALAQRIQPRLEVALQAVRLAAAGAARDPAVQLARGRVEREAGEVDSALAGFRAALASGGDSGIVLLELGRTEFYARHPASGGRSYFAGARAARTAAAIALFREDLQWAATPDELAAYDRATDGAARVQWLLTFWSRRDVADARDDGERLAEHYRRWFYARKHFRLVSRHRHYDITEVFRSKQTEFDDRGVIYLRHGEPDRRAQYICPPGDERCAPNESWLYRRPTGDLVFHFAARDDVQDFKLVESLVDVLGFQAGVRAGAAGGGAPELAALYQSRETFGELYRRVAGSNNSPGPALAAERSNGKRTIAQGTTTDSYAQRFELPLDVVLSEFIAGGERDAATPTLHVVFAIPAERLTPDPATDGVVYPLRFRIVVADTSGRLIARLDTTRVFGARQPLRRPAYLTGRLALPVNAGPLKYRVLVALADGSAGEVVSRDSLVADTLDGRHFAASDLVVGVRGSGLTWPRGADTIALNPLGNVTEDGALEVYYQLFGLAPGASYHTEIEVARAGGGSIFGAIGRLFGGRRAPVRLAFDATAEGPLTEVQRTVSLQGVAKGTYTLTVRLTESTRGTLLIRTRRFTIVGR
jgi:GWxTD domain-containing protein